MWLTRFGNEGTFQDLYFEEDNKIMPQWFKGMELIISERRLWLERDLMLSARASSTRLERLIAAAVAYCLCSLTLWLENTIWRN